MPPSKIGILYHPLKEPARVLAAELGDWLRAKGIAAWESSAWELERAQSRATGTGLLITTGGDGTILHAVQVAVRHDIPVLGINLGKLGFMTELRADEARPALTAILEGKGWLDERAMLQAEVVQKGSTRSYTALNDVVAARGAVARVITIEASVDDQPLTVYRADGAIVATATGSTGYSLAAGGPILHPHLDNILLTPISPHLCLLNTLVLPGTAAVRLRVGTMHEATLSIDGIINSPLADGATVTVKRSPAKARFLHLQPPAFYGNLEQKLRGKQG